MVQQRYQRGPVGKAAEALKNALASRLTPGVKDSPINDGIYTAINLVNAFLHAHKESQPELEALKVQVRSIVMNKLAASGGSRTARGAADLQPSTSPRNDAEVASASRISAYSRASSTRSCPASRTTSLDWTLPSKLLKTKAYIQGGDFSQLTLKQDELARKADKQRLVDNAEQKRSTLRMFDQQMALVNQKRAEEREARRKAQLEMDESIRLYQADEVARMERERDAQASMRVLFAGQVSELNERKRQEAEQLAREQALERQALTEEAQRERQRLEALAASNAQQRERINKELREATAAKAAARSAQVVEEQRYNKEYVAKMDADEAARRRAVELRAEKLRQAFERGGGVALQKGLEEQARLDAERAERMQAQFEAEQAEKDRRAGEKRRQDGLDTLRTLDAQVAHKQAERRAAAAEAAALRTALTAQLAADKAREKEDLRALRASQADMLKRQKEDMKAEHKKWYNEYREPFESKYAWLHTGAREGTRRAFNNLAVPQGREAMLATVVL